MLLKRHLSLLLGLVMLLALLPVQARAADKPTSLMLGIPGLVTVGQEITLTATLSRVRSNEKAKYLSDQVIRFVIDGVEVGSAVTNPTDENQNKDELSGQASLTYKVTLEQGYHTVTAYYDGDDKYEPAASGMVMRVRLPGQHWTALKGRVSPTTARAGQVVEMTATLLDLTAKTPIAGHTIIFQVDNQEVGRAVTDERGTAVFGYVVESAPGPHRVRILSEPNDQYAEARVMTGFTVPR